MIIAAGPLTSRNGRSDSRSIATPSPPAASIVTLKAKANAPASASPVSTWPWPEMPSASSAHMPINELTINTLKWAKLISSRMP